jgi:hypothetical protein
MSKHQWEFRLKLMSLLVIPLIVGAGCRTCGKVPCFQTDASVRDACQGKNPGDHTVEVNDMGGVSDNCVVIKRDYPQAGNWVHWLPKSSGHRVSITFVLGQKQEEPFQNMACGGPDPHGNRLCSLLDCPGPCKTTFRVDYQPSKTNPDLNYYYYSPGISTIKAGGAKSGSDPGIRIDP